MVVPCVAGCGGANRSSPTARESVKLVEVLIEVGADADRASDLDRMIGTTDSHFGSGSVNRAGRLVGALSPGGWGAVGNGPKQENQVKEDHDGSECRVSEQTQDQLL
jgi:hypothetical protein